MTRCWMVGEGASGTGEIYRAVVPGKDLYEVRIERQVERGKMGPKAVPYTAADIDFLAVFVVPERTWYIFPVEELRGRTRLNLHAEGHGPGGVNAGARERWDLFRVRLGKASVRRGSGVVSC